MSLPKPLRMSADEFLAWAMEQPEGRRYELASGEVVAMAPERAAHALTKFAVARALRDAVREAGLSCLSTPAGFQASGAEQKQASGDAGVTT